MSVDSGEIDALIYESPIDSQLRFLLNLDSIAKTPNSSNLFEQSIADELIEVPKIEFYREDSKVPHGLKLPKIPSIEIGAEKYSEKEEKLLHDLHIDIDNLDQDRSLDENEYINYFLSRVNENSEIPLAISWYTRRIREDKSTHYFLLVNGQLRRYQEITTYVDYFDPNHEFPIVPGQDDSYISVFSSYLSTDIFFYDSREYVLITASHEHIISASFKVRAFDPIINKNILFEIFEFRGQIKSKFVEQDGKEDAHFDYSDDKGDDTGVSFSEKITSVLRNRKLAIQEATNIVTGSSQVPLENIIAGYVE